MLPTKIKNGLLTLTANRKDLTKLAEYISEPLSISPSGDNIPDASAASSMVEVAQKLFSSNDMNVIAIDMPLEVSPQESMEKMLCKLGELNYQKGVLLLVDMGSLCNFGAMIIEEISKKYQIIATVGMVKPKGSIPLISLERLIGGEGEPMLAALLHVEDKMRPKERNAVVKNLCEESLQKFLTYLNPGKVISVLIEFSMP